MKNSLKAASNSGFIWSILKVPSGPRIQKEPESTKLKLVLRTWTTNVCTVKACKDDTFQPSKSMLNRVTLILLKLRQNFFQLIFLGKYHNKKLLKFSELYLKKQNAQTDFDFQYYQSLQLRTTEWGNFENLLFFNSIC